MSAWSPATIYIYKTDGSLYKTITDCIESEGDSAWHEIGKGSHVIVPYTALSQVTADYTPGRRVKVLIYSNVGAVTHLICDFVIEAIKIEERPLDSGGTYTAIRVEGRPIIKELTHYAVNRRCISTRYDSAANATSVTSKSITLAATDKSTLASYGVNLIGWTVEMADGAWSQVTAYNATTGVATIDPAWSTYVEASGDVPESGIPLAAQRWMLYGTTATNTTGVNTDLKQVIAFTEGTWVLEQSPNFDTTANGTFTTPNGANVMRTLVAIAQQSGEYFRVIGGSRIIEWFRAVPTVTHPSYGRDLVISKTHTPGGTIYVARPLPGASLQLDGYEAVTRVRPKGDGSGDEALSLKHLPAGFTPAAGYAIDGEYLVYTVGDNAARVARDITFPLIGQANDGATSKAAAATALYNAALVWLKEHTGSRKVIQVEVDSPLPIPALSQLYAFFPELSVTMMTMYVLASTATYKDGNLTYKLTLSDKRAPYMDDERLIAEALVVSGGNGGGGAQSTTSAPRNSRKVDKGGSIIISGEGVTDHGLLTGLADNDHPQYTLASTFTTHAADPAAHHAPVTLANTGLELTGQAVGLRLAATSGLQITGTGAVLADTVAGQGLTIAGKVISIALPADSGLVITADTLGMGTPGSITSASTSAVTGSGHTHAAPNTSNAKTNPLWFLRGDANGDVWMRYLTADKVVTAEVETATGALMLDPATGVTYNDGNLSFIGSRIIDSDTGSITLAPAANLVIDPAGDLAVVNPNVTLKTNHWSSGFLGTGWGITYDGVGEFRKLQADELHVQAFIADTARVKVGSEYITPSMALVSRTFTVPGVGSSATLYVEDAPGLADMQIFHDNDWILLRILDRSGGGLVVANVWGQVTSYSNLADGEQSWTFTTRSSSVSGAKAQRGSVALDFGQAGDGWIWLTTLDAAGSPYLGISTWQGANPYTEGNRRHLVRLGQLRGTSGVTEWGLRAGFTASNYVHFSDMKSEIHNARLSLYAGDGGSLRVAAANVIFWQTAAANTILYPNADHSSYNVSHNSSAFWDAVNEASPNYSDYIANSPNRNGYVFLGLTAQPAYTTINKVQIRVASQGSGIVDDTINLYAQVFAADEITPLTGEVLVRAAVANSGIDSTVDFPQHDARTAAINWTNARLRLRWEYATNAAAETIRLDPAVPSIAVGNPLPTGSTGTGFWTGLDGGVYKARIGDASGVNLLWTGTALELRNSGNTPAITLASDGTSEFTGAMTLGTNGGIWQGAGSFATPTAGLKIWRDVGTGVGRLETYSGGVAQVSLDTAGKLTAGAGRVKLDATGLTLVSNSGAYGGTGDLRITTFTGTRMAALESYYISNMNETRLRLSAYGSTGLSDPPAFLDFDVIGSVAYSYLTGGYQLTINADDRMTLNAGNRASIVAANTLLNQGGDDGEILSLVSSDIAHGMTAVTGTSTYGFLQKFNDLGGGLLMTGLGEAYAGLTLRGYVTSADTSTSRSSSAPVAADGYVKSGTGGVALADGANIFAVRNAGSNRVIVKGNGDLYSDSSTSITLYDAYDDVALLRSLSHAINPAAVVRNQWDAFVRYNRADLEAAGILDGDMVNQTALGRLLTGAIWQLHTKIQELERRLS